MVEALSGSTNSTRLQRAEVALTLCRSDAPSLWGAVWRSDTGNIKKAQTDLSGGVAADKLALLNASARAHGEGAPSTRPVGTSLRTTRFCSGAFVAPTLDIFEE